MDNQKAERRVQELNNLTLDVTQKDNTLQSFSELLTLITGAQFSQINIFDQDTQYTIASDGALFPPLPKETTFCTYTLDQESTLEIPDMSFDERVKDHFAVQGEPYARFYFGSPLITKNEVAIGTVCIIHDEKIELTEEQRKAIHTIAEQVTRHLELKNTLVRNDKVIEEQRNNLHKVAHDLRAPISAILGSISVLDREDLDEKINKILTIIQKSCRNLSEYVNETLRSKLEVQDEPRSNFITAAELEEKLRSLYDLQAKEKDITLNIEHELKEGEKITTLSSGDLLNITGNLITNAIKFTPEHGSVSVHTGYREDSEQKEYQITVTDTGKGMKEEQVETIRQHKRATPDTGSNDEKGYGIGLYQSLQTLKNNEGSFDIDTAPGEGTQFRIYFPRKYR